MADIVPKLNIEIGANTSGLEKAIKAVDNSLKSTQKQLREVDKALKLDPSNIDLITRKQELLARASEQTREQIALLTQKMEQHGDSLPEDEYNELVTAITVADSSLKNLEAQEDEAAKAAADLASGTTDAGDAAEGAGDQFEGAGDGAESVGDQRGDAGSEAESAGGDFGDAGDAAAEAGQQAENSGEGWTIVKSIIADLAKDAIKKAVDGLKSLGKAITTSVKDSAAFADEVLTLSTVTGLATDTIQELKYSAELLDTDFETVQKSLFKLTNNMRSARDGNESLTKAFKACGIAIKDDVTGELRNSEEVFYELIDYLGTVENSTERDAIAMQFFGKSAQDLNPLIAAGAEGMKAFADEAHAAGAVMDGEALESLGAMDDGFQRLDQSVQVAQRNLALALAPAITTVSETFAEMARDKDWKNIFSDLGDAVAEILPDLTSIAKTVLPAIMSVLQKVLPVVSELIGTIDFGPLIDVIIENLITLTPILAQLAADMLPELVDLLVALTPIITQVLQIIQPFINVIGPMLGNVLQALAFALTIVSKLIGDTVIPIVQKLQGVSDSLGNHFRKLADDLSVMRVATATNWESAKTSVDAAVSAMASKVGQKFGEILSAARSKFQEVKSAITEPFNNAWAAIQNFVSKIKNAFNGVSLSIPKIKMPHLSVSGTWSFNPPRVPSFSVRWYRDAMQNGMILNSPTIFGAMNGRLLGAGEAGPEAVIGVSSLRELIRDAVNSSVNNYDYGGVNVVVYGAPGQDVNELANIIEDRINANIARRAAAF